MIAQGSSGEGPSLATASPRVTYSYAILILDVILRWITWLLCLPKGDHELRLWLLQLLAVPILVCIFAAAREGMVRKRAELGKFGDFTPEVSAMRLSVCLVAVILAGTMAWRHMFSVPFTWLRVMLTIIGILAYIAYLSILWAFSIRIDDSPEPFLPPQRTPGLVVDENDRCIIELDALKESFRQRVDTYTLESALFGALAFSAFVTIIASDHQNATGVREFADGLIRSLHALVNLDLQQVWARLAVRGADAEAKLFAVIAFDTLVCALMFLAVIICRLRFTDLLNLADRSIRMASSYNAKEDEIHMMQLEHPELATALNSRIDKLTAEIEMLICEAERHLRQSKPVLTYMSGFRRAGVVGFLIVLITSAVWVAPEWALGFAIFGFIAFAYPTLDRWLRDSNLHGGDRLARISRFLRPRFLG